MNNRILIASMCFCLAISTMIYPASGLANVAAYTEILGVQPRMIIQLTFPYNINTDYVTTTVVNTGTVTQSNNMAVLQTGTNTTGSAMLTSNGILPHYAGQGSVVMFTALFNTGVANSIQQIGIGGFNTTPAIQDGFFFGYNGTSFGIFWYNNSTTPTFIAQTSWNNDTMNGAGPSGVTLVPTSGNVYKIQFQWLGFGAINFFIEDPKSGNFIRVHQIKYANANTTPSLGNPSMQLIARVVNSGSNTNKTFKTSSMCAFIEGKLNIYNDNRHSVFNTKTITNLLGGVDTNILTIQNKATYQGVANQVMVYPDFLTFVKTTVNNSAFILRLYLNPTVAGTPSFTDISTNTSVVSYDTAGTSISGGTLLVTFYFGGNTPAAYPTLSTVVNLADMALVLKPGDTLVITGEVPAILSSQTAYVGISWLERF